MIKTQSGAQGKPWLAGNWGAGRDSHWAGLAREGSISQQNPGYHDCSWMCITLVSFQFNFFLILLQHSLKKRGTRSLGKTDKKSSVQVLLVSLHSRRQHNPKWQVLV